MFRFRRLVWRLLQLPGPPPGVTLEDARALFDRGMELIGQGQPEKALTIARELNGYRYTGGWEVEAVALHEMGDAESAIEVLQKGTRIKPVWRIGHLLGIYLSDEGRYEEALEAFEASLDMLEAEPMMTRYNQAIVHNRAGRTEEAVRLLQDVVSCESKNEEQEAVELATAFLTKLTANEPCRPPPRRRKMQRSTGRRR